MRIATLKEFSSGEYKYIYVYYKKSGSIIRINTGNKIIPGGMQKDLLYNAKVPNRHKLNDKTIQMLQDVNRYINRKLELNQKPNQKECKRYLEKKISLYSDLAHPKKYGKTFMDYYEEFFNYKKRTVKSKLSLKDYTSLRNALIDYEGFTNEKLSFDNINSQNFLPLFNEYLINERHQADTTINKRVQSLKTFMGYVENEDVFIFKQSAKKFKVGKVPATQIVLTTDDLILLKSIKLSDDKKQRILDLFIMNCFLGMSYSDLRLFDAGNLESHNEQILYVIKRKKSKVECVVPVGETALAILKKYDYKPFIPTAQYFNRTIKEIFAENNIFADKVKVTRIVNGEGKASIKLKRDLVCSHTCRRTYITRAIEANIPLNVVQRATGHRLVTTLNKYSKPVDDYSAFRAMEI